MFNCQLKPDIVPNSKEALIHLCKSPPALTSTALCLSIITFNLYLHSLQLWLASSFHLNMFKPLAC